MLKWLALAAVIFVTLGYANETTLVSGNPDRVRVSTECTERTERLTGLLAESSNLLIEGLVRVELLAAENARLRRENAESGRLHLGP